MFVYFLVLESLIVGGFIFLGLWVFILFLFIGGFSWWVCFWIEVVGFFLNVLVLWMLLGFLLIILLLSCLFVIFLFIVCLFIWISKNINIVNFSIIICCLLIFILEEVFFMLLCLILFYRWLLLYVNEFSVNCVGICKIICFVVNFNMIGDLLII